MLDFLESLLTQAWSNLKKKLLQPLSREQQQAPIREPLTTALDTSTTPLVNPTHASRLGEILVRQRLISEAELEAILAKQQETNDRLGELLLKKFLVTEDQLQQALRNQRIRLGELLVAKRLISQELLQDFLASQSRTQQSLGQLLVQADWLSEAQLNAVLREQYWRRNGYWVID